MPEPFFSPSGLFSASRTCHPCATTRSAKYNNAHSRSSSRCPGCTRVLSEPRLASINYVTLSIRLRYVGGDSDFYRTPEIWCVCSLQSDKDKLSTSSASGSANEVEGDSDYEEDGDDSAMDSGGVLAKGPDPPMAGIQNTQKLREPLRPIGDHTHVLISFREPQKTTFESADAGKSKPSRRRDEQPPKRHFKRSPNSVSKSR